VSRPVRLLQRLLGRETTARDPRLALAGQDMARELEAALEDLVEQRMETKRGFSARGSRISIRKLLFGHPSEWFISIKGHYEPAPRELVIANAGNLTVNPLQAEILQGLFERGFTVTLYTSPTEFVEGIRTLTDFQTLYSNSGNGWFAAGAAPRDIIGKDLAARKKEGSYALHTLVELQKSVEDLYIYGLSHRALQGTLPDAQQLPGPDTRAEQIRGLQAWVQTLGLPAVVVQQRGDGKIILHLRGVMIETVANAGPWPIVDGLVLQDAMVGEPDLFFKLFPNVRYIDGHGASFTTFKNYSSLKYLEWLSWPEYPKDLDLGDVLVEFPQGQLTIEDRVGRRWQRGRAGSFMAYGQKFSINWPPNFKTPLRKAIAITWGRKFTRQNAQTEKNKVLYGGCYRT